MKKQYEAGFGQRTKDKRQKTKDKGQRTKDKGYLSGFRGSKAYQATHDFTNIEDLKKIRKSAEKDAKKIANQVRKKTKKDSSCYKHNPLIASIKIDPMFYDSGNKRKTYIDHLLQIMVIDSFYPIFIMAKWIDKNQHVWFHSPGIGEKTKLSLFDYYRKIQNQDFNRFLLEEYKGIKSLDIYFATNYDRLKDLSETIEAIERDYKFKLFNKKLTAEEISEIPDLIRFQYLKFRLMEAILFFIRYLDINVDNQSFYRLHGGWAKIKEENLVEFNKREFKATSKKQQAEKTILSCQKLFRGSEKELLEEKKVIELVQQMKKANLLNNDDAKAVLAELFGI